MQNDYLPEQKKFHYQELTPPSGPTFLRSSLRTIFRHKFHIVGFFIVTVSFVTIFTFLTPKVYQSEAKIFIKLGRENVAIDPSIPGPTAPVRTDRESELNSEVAALKSRIIIEEAVEQIGPRHILYPGEMADGEVTEMKNFSLSRLLINLGIKSPVPKREIAADKVMTNLDIGAEKQSHIITLSYRAESPEGARDFLNVLIDKFRDRHIDMHRTQAPLQFFEVQAEKLRSDLQSKEDQLKIFQEENSIASLDAQKEKLLDQVGRLRAETDEVSSLVAASSAKIGAINKSLQGRSPHRELSRVVGLPNRTVDAIKSRIFELRSQEADLSAHYPDTDRGLVELREKIRQAEKQLSLESESLTEVTQGVDTNYQALQLSLANEQAEFQAMNARMKALTAKLEERTAELLKLTSHETTLRNLQREIDIANGEYQQYRGSLQRAKISEDLDAGRISNVNVIQPPSLSYVPVSPRKRLNLLLGVLLGIVGGLGLAFVRERFDGSIKGADDVEEKLGLPVLASISRQDFKACT